MEVDEECFQWSLDNLPIEVIIHICRFLEPDIILNILPLVSKRFEEIALDEGLWRIRIARRWPYKYPPGEAPQDFLWSTACSAREQFCKQWSSRSLRTEVVAVRGHHSAVDSLILVRDGSLLISGSRDRTMALWRTDAMKNDDIQSGLLHKDFYVNKGWIWSLNYNPDTSDLISTGWDNMIHLWKLSNDGMNLQGSLNCKTAVLCSAMNQNLVTVGTFDKFIKTYDVRVQPNKNTGESTESDASKIEEYKVHKKPVLSVIVPSNNSNQIISASEDGSVALIDRRAKKVVKRTHFTKGYPMRIKQFQNSLYVGDKAGNLHLLDLSSASPLKVLKTMSELHSGKVIGIDTDLGGIVTCSSDSKIHLLQPDMSCGIIETIDCKEYDEVTAVAYSNGVLASGHSLERIQVWRPKRLNEEES